MFQKIEEGAAENAHFRTMASIQSCIGRSAELAETKDQSNVLRLFDEDRQHLPTKDAQR
jgi:hypothetical protein